MKEDTSEVLLDEQTSRSISKEGLARQVAAGSKNLSLSRSKAYARRRDLQVEVTSYRDDLLASAGPNLSPSKVALVEGVVTSYASLIRIRYEILRSSRSEIVVLTERVSWLTSNMARLLRLLNLDAKPRPRFLGDTGFAKVAQSSEIAPAKGGILAPKSAEEPRS